jgi:hypothetical protein
MVQVMGFLIAADSVLGEAHDRHVRVSRAKVRRVFDHLRHEQFRRARQFRRFLAHSKETVGDLLLRIKVQLLAKKILQRVIAGHREQRGRDEALGHYFINFARKWKARTYCAAGYAVPDCGHVQAGL